MKWRSIGPAVFALAFATIADRDMHSPLQSIAIKRNRMTASHHGGRRQATHRSTPAMRFGVAKAPIPFEGVIARTARTRGRVPHWLPK